MAPPGSFPSFCVPAVKHQARRTALQWLLMANNVVEGTISCQLGTSSRPAQVGSDISLTLPRSQDQLHNNSSSIFFSPDPHLRHKIHSQVGLGEFFMCPWASLGY